jgi:hypothetical protein
LTAQFVRAVRNGILGQVRLKDVLGSLTRLRQCLYGLP